MIKGTPKADAITLMEVVRCDFLSGADNPRLRVRAAYVVSNGGATLGQLEHENWSKETLERLKQLKESIEKDIADVYFSDRGSPSLGAASTSTANAPKGLADYLGNGDDAPPA